MRDVKRCALYVRVSTRNQMGGEYDSLETQRERLEAYVHSQENWKVHRLYSDGGFSGEGLRRPGLQQLLGDISAGQVDCVLVYKIDRLTRNPRDFYTLVELFGRHNVSFISVTQHFDTSTPMGRLLRNILLEFAQFEREMTAERTRDKTQQRAQKGFWIGGKPPFGYRLADGRLRVDEGEAKVVQLMFGHLAVTESLAKVRHELNARGYKTRSGKSWSKTSIDNTVRNPVHIGKIRYRDQIFPGQHEPIIEVELFDKVQSLHRSERHVTTRTKRTFLLRGLLRCQECGSMMTPHYTKKKAKTGYHLYFYYRCSKTMHHDRTVCTLRQIKADKIESVILGDIGSLVSDSDLLVSAIEKQNKQQDQGLTSLTVEDSKLESRIRELEGEANNYVEALGKGKLSIERLEKALERVQGEIDTLEVRRAELQHRVEEAELKRFDHKVIADNLNRFQETFSTLSGEEQAECLQLILKDVVISQDTVQLNIWDLPEFRWDSSKKRQDWLLR